MDRKKSPFVPMVFGLVLLFVFMAWLIHSPPPVFPVTPAQIKAKETERATAFNFIRAERMAKELCPSPLIHWSHFGLDLQSICVQLPNGVWYASGTADSTDHARVPWRAYFLDDAAEPLLVQAGDWQSEIKAEDFGMVLKAMAITQSSGMNKREAPSQ